MSNKSSKTANNSLKTSKGGSKLGVSAFVLLLSGLVCKALGALFRLPLTNMLGIEGIGVFQLVMSLFSFALVVTCGGVTNALSKLISSARAKGEDKKIGVFLLRAIFSGLAVGLILGALFFALSRQICALQGIDAATSYMLFLVLLPLGAALAALRGFFQGHENMFPTAISQVLEQGVKFALGLAFAFLFGRSGVAQGVFGAFLGIVASEIVALSYLCVVFFVRNARRMRVLGQKNFFGGNANITNLGQTAFVGGNIPPAALAEAANIESAHAEIGKLKSSKPETASVVQAAAETATEFVSRQNLSESVDGNQVEPSKNVKQQKAFRKKKRFEVTQDVFQAKRAFDRANFPLMLSASVLPLVSAFDSLVIVARLSFAGFSTAESTQLFGLQSGVVGAILNFPLIISIAVTTTLLPNISFLVSRGTGGKHIVERGLKVLLFLILPTTFGMVAISRPVLALLYSGMTAPLLDTAFLLMFYGAFSTVLTALMQYFVMLLQANGQFRFILLITAIGGVFKAVLSFFLASVPSVNIFALVIGNIVLSGTICALALWKLKKTISLRLGLWDIFLLLFATLVMFVAVFCFLNFDYFHPILNIVLAIGLGVFVYVVLSMPFILKILPALKNHRPFKKKV